MKYLYLGVLLCFIGSCQQYKDQPLNPEQNLTAYKLRSLKQHELTSFLKSAIPDRQWPPKSWDLAALTLASFYYQPELNIYRARWGIAQSNIKSASQYPNPTLSLIPAFNSTTSSSEGISPWIVDSALDFTYHRASKRNLQIAEAKSLSEVARLELAQTAWKFRSRIRNAMINLYEARQLQKLLKEYCSFQQRNIKFLEATQALGEISPFEVYQGRIALSTAKLDSLQAQKKYTQALGSLAEAIGVPRKSLEGVSIKLNWCGGDLPAILPDAKTQRKAMLNRADLLGMLAKYQASQLALQLEISKQYPDITIGPGYSFDQSENKWALGISLNLPVFNQNQGAIAAARKRREAAAEFNTLQAVIVHKIDQAIENYKISRKQFNVASTLVNEQKQKINLQKKMLAVGEITQQKLLTSLLELNNDYRLQLQARIDAQQALGQLEDAMQTPADLPRWKQTIFQSKNKNEVNNEKN